MMMVVNLLVMLLAIAEASDISVKLDQVINSLQGNEFYEVFTLIQSFITFLDSENENLRLKIQEMEKKNEEKDILLTQLQKDMAKIVREHNETVTETASANNTRAPVISNDTLCPEESTGWQHFIAATSCHDWKQRGCVKSGNYAIDPDGTSGALSALSAYCNMSTGSTLIQHKAEVAELVCEERNCSSAEIQYDATEEQMVVVMRSSERCTQSIQFLLEDAAVDVTLGWRDRHGNNRTLCSCTNSSCCSGESITITDKTLLPLSSIFISQAGNVSVKQIQYTLSGFECDGVDVSYPVACVDVVASSSGYYLLGEPEGLFLVYCNFTNWSESVIFNVTSFKTTLDFMRRAITENGMSIDVLRDGLVGTLTLIQDIKDSLL